MKSFWLILSLLFVLLSCDQGLAPPPPERPTGIRGTVVFVNDWPPPDSVQELRVVAFQRFPFEDSAGIIAEVLAGRAFFSDTLPRFVDSATYEVLLQPPFPDTLRYVAVAWRYGPNLFGDWWVAAVYGSFSQDTVVPRKIPVIPQTVVESVDMRVDFRHLPPQPFE